MVVLQLLKIKSIDDINDHNDKSLNKGICARKFILFTLTRELAFEELEVGGFAGSSWNPSWGSEASIMVSLDKINWIGIGNIPSNILEIQ